MEEHQDSWRMHGNRNQGWRTKIEGYSNSTSSCKVKSTSINTGNRKQTATNRESGTRLFHKKMKYLQKQQKWWRRNWEYEK